MELLKMKVTYKYLFPNRYPHSWSSYNVALYVKIIAKMKFIIFNGCLHKLLTLCVKVLLEICDSTTLDNIWDLTKGDIINNSIDNVRC